jgi:hypothetical protein
MLKIAFIPMSFLHFFAVFYKKYSDLLQVVFQCKKYSENTVENGTRGKTVIFTADIFAVYCSTLSFGLQLESQVARKPHNFLVAPSNGHTYYTVQCNSISLLSPCLTYN